jgi:transcriptional regulator with XRE-family HTH domain
VGVLAADHLSGASMRERRHKLGLTQVELARALGVSGNTVARWERGTLRIAYPERVRAAIEVLIRTASDAAAGDASERGKQRPHNLPAPFTRFFGRQLEIRQLGQLLLTSRLITLAGAAGIGKTRLALELGASVVHSFRDGVWLVELASINDPQMIARGVAATLTWRSFVTRSSVSTSGRSNSSLTPKEPAALGWCT